MTAAQKKPRRSAVWKVFRELGRDRRIRKVPGRGLSFAAGAHRLNAWATGDVSVDQVNANYFFFFAFLAFFLTAFFFAFGMRCNSSNVSSGSGESTAPQNVNNMSGLQCGLQYPWGPRQYAPLQIIHLSQ